MQLFFSIFLQSFCFSSFSSSSLLLPLLTALSLSLPLLLSFFLLPLLSLPSPAASSSFLLSSSMAGLLPFFIC
ncbi:hypothetical protein ACOSQ2_021286 [Xanthoceras sorbifolium]